MNKNLVTLTDEEADIIGSALLRDIRATKQAIEENAPESHPRQHTSRLARLRSAFAALGEAAIVE